MIKRHRILVLGCIFILVAGLALWPGGWPPRAYANVTLVSFTADSLPGLPEIYIEWVTATEIDTVGFFIARSDSATGTFTRVGDYIPSEGDDITGWEYSEVDDTTTLNMTYYYRLEVVNTDQTIDYHGPIRVVAGVEATDVPGDTGVPTSTPTPDLTPSPTLTPSPSTTSTMQPSAQVTNPTASSSSASVATPLGVTGTTITPRPTVASNSSNLVAASATPDLSPNVDGQLQPTPLDASVPAVPNAATVPTAALPPSSAEIIAQAPVPTLVPADAVPAVVAPVVIVTEAEPSAAPANTTNNGAPLLIIAAVLFLGLAFVILRQAR